VQVIASGNSTVEVLKPRPCAGAFFFSDPLIQV
jgi:hypothetical protein